MSRLCDEHKVNLSGKRAVQAQVMTLLLVLGLNIVAKSVLDSRYSGAVNFLFGEKWKLLQSQTQPSEVLVLGDSSGAFCFESDYLSRSKDMRCLNIATVGFANIVNDVWMLNTYLEKFAPPKVVFLIKHVSLWSWNNPDAATLASSDLPYGFWRTFSPAITMPWNEKLRFINTRYNILYSKKAVIAGLLRPWHRSWTLQGLSASGYPQMEGVTLPAGKNDEMGPILSARQPFRISEMNLRALQDLQSICAANNITLVICNAPVYRETSEDPYFPEFLSQAKTSLETFATPEKNTLTIFPEPMLFDRNEGYDRVHLRPDAARRYTDAILKSLSEAVKK